MDMGNRIPFKDTAVIGFMLFALFFGAGNLVFPAMLGQSAGTNIGAANLGFLITGVGLPLIAVLAFGFSGKEDLLALAGRAHPAFGIVFTTVLYLTIGPLFAIPRTGSVSYEIGIKPFLSESSGQLPLLMFTVLYFVATCLFSLRPAKLIDIVGKILTPILIVFIGILAAAGMAMPMGEHQSPDERYRTSPFFNGFQEGYLTMDTLAAFVFGIIIIQAIQEKGADSRQQMLKVCLKATAISAVVLAVIYSALSYLGAASVEQFGHLDNGGEVLSNVSHYYFGTFGGVILGVIVIVACLTTSIGLTTACGTFLHKLIPGISYRSFAIGLSVFSAALANFGLAQLISISVPVLSILYPLAIVLIILTFLHPLFKGEKLIYLGCLLFTFIVSVVDSLQLKYVHVWFGRYLPLYELGLGWMLPALAGGLTGWCAAWLLRRI